LENELLHNSGHTSQFLFIGAWFMVHYSSLRKQWLESRVWHAEPFLVPQLQARHWGSWHLVPTGRRSAASSLQGHIFPWYHIPQQVSWQRPTYRVAATVTRPHPPRFSFLGLRQGQRVRSSFTAVLKWTARQNPWCNRPNDCRWRYATCSMGRVPQPAEETSSTYKQTLECWATVVQQFLLTSKSLLNCTLICGHVEAKMVRKL
jgi:hypothetical protein